jgi:hypothetical protein
MNKSKPVLITFSVLAGLQVLTGAAALADVIGQTAFGLFAITVAAVQVGMTFFVQNQVTPTKDVAAYDTGNEQGIVAGPAAAPVTGTPVAVVAAPPLP